MKKFIITTLGVLAVTLTFAQEQGKEGIHINKQSGEKEKVVFIRPQKQMAAIEIAEVRKKHVDQTTFQQRVNPNIKKYKAKLQSKDKMAPKGNFKTK